MFEVREPCEITTLVQKGAIIVAIGFRITWVQNIQYLITVPNGVQELCDMGTKHNDNAEDRRKSLP